MGWIESSTLPELPEISVTQMPGPMTAHWPRRDDTFLPTRNTQSGSHLISINEIFQESRKTFEPSLSFQLDKILFISDLTDADLTHS